MNRSFTAETWTNIIAKKSWYEAIDEATDMIDDDIETDIKDMTQMHLSFVRLAEMQRKQGWSSDSFSAKGK